MRKLSMRRVAKLLPWALLCWGMTAFAADLSITVDRERNLAVITNTLSTDVTLLNLLATDQRRLPLFNRLPAGATVQAPLRFAMPATVSYAVCEIAAPLEGMKKARDNYFHLSVDIR